MAQAVIFDMDGLLLDSEVYWEKARKAYCRSVGCDWTDEDEATVKGNNSPEWAVRIKKHCALGVARDEIIRDVEARMRTLYDEHLPLLPGAVATVRDVAARYPTGIASSSPPDLIQFVMAAAGLSAYFSVIVSADTVGRGKPAPDVFLAAATQLGYAPSEITVFEDSSAGITAGKAAGMRVIAVPNPRYPPTEMALGMADVVLTSLLEFRPELVSN